MTEGINPNYTIQTTNPNKVPIINENEEMDLLFNLVDETMHPNATAPKKNQYLPTSSENFNSTIEAGMQYLENLSAEQLNTYNTHLSNIRYNADETINLEDPGTIKAYMAFKKLEKYKGEVPEASNRINENCTLLGEYSIQYNDFVTYLRSNQELFDSMDNFTKSIYSDDGRFFILPENEVSAAKEYAQAMLAEECEKWGIENIEDYIEYSEENSSYTNITLVSSIDNEWNDWKMKIYVNKDGKVGDKQCSMEVVLLHELYHAKQTKPGIDEATYDEKGENSHNNFIELGATIDLIVRNDELHKKVNNIPLDEEVFYENTVSFEENEINFGLIANTFREIKSKYNLETYEEALLTPEGQNFVMKHFS